MRLLKVALLEDDKVFLKELVDNLERTEMVDIIVAERKSEKFIEKVKSQEVDVLLLDIELLGESITGVEVAEILKKPVLFLSSKTKNYLEKILQLKLHSKYPIDEFEKTKDSENLKSILRKFIPRIKEFQGIQNSLEDNRKNTIMNSEYLVLKTSEARSERIALKQIALIRTCNKEPRDKEIYLIDSNVIKAKNISLVELLLKLPSEQFLQINNSDIVNKNQVSKLFSIDEIGVLAGTITHRLILGDKFKDSFFTLLPELKS